MVFLHLYSLKKRVGPYVALLNRCVLFQRNSYAKQQTNSRFGHRAVVKLLLERDGVDVNAKNKSGETLLCSSASNGDIVIVELLLQCDDIDLNVESNGLTPLMAAERYGHEAIVRLLLGHIHGDFSTPERPLGLRKRGLQSANSTEDVAPWIHPTIRGLCKELGAPDAAPYILTGVTTILTLLSPSEQRRRESKGRQEG
jgi:hypothetical protein